MKFLAGPYARAQMAISCRMPEGPVHQSKFLSAMDEYHLNVMPTMNTIYSEHTREGCHHRVCSLANDPASPNQIRAEHIWLCDGITTPLVDLFLDELVSSPFKISYWAPGYQRTEDHVVNDYFGVFTFKLRQYWKEQSKMWRGAFDQFLQLNAFDLEKRFDQGKSKRRRKDIFCNLLISFTIFRSWVEDKTWGERKEANLLLFNHIKFDMLEVFLK